MGNYDGLERRQRSARWQTVERLWRNLVPLLAVCLAAWVTLGLRTEAAERRNQNCLVFERQHLTNVNRLKATYLYLQTLPLSHYGKPLTLAILRGLKAQEEEARTDQAPAYCDEPGAEAEEHGEEPVGLPEPDPSVPPKQDFSDLAQRP